MAFLDEEEPLAGSGGDEPPFRRVPDRQRQIMMRRAIGVGALVLILILLVVGIRGCLNARKERNFENYVSDLNAIATQTTPVSKPRPVRKAPNDVRKTYRSKTDINDR